MVSLSRQFALLLRCQMFAGGAFNQTVLMRRQHKPIGASNGALGWYVNCTRRRALSAYRSSENAETVGSTTLDESERNGKAETMIVFAGRSRKTETLS